MPPKPKVTKEMIIDAAFEIAENEGWENINTRTVAQKLHSSTQPVMYQFKTMDDLKRSVYVKADRLHTEYLMNAGTFQKGVMLGIGLNYIRFSIEKPQLFRLLFQSGYAAENSLLEMIDSEELKPVLSVMQSTMNMTEEQTKRIFVTIALFAHGYASIIANNSLEYNEDIVAEHLERAYRGAVLEMYESEKNSP